MIPQYIADIIFIVSNEGIPYLVHDTKITKEVIQDPSESILMAGFMSAIQSFLKSLTKADLRVIDGGTDKIIIHRDDRFSVAAITQLSLVNEVMTILMEIAREFDNHFHEILTDDEQIYSTDIYETFRPHVMDLIDVNRVITVGSNDIYRRFVSNYAKVGQRHIIETYGDGMMTFYSKLDGQKTMYQILFEENLLGVIRDFENKLKSMYKENLIQKIPMSQKNLQILSLTFNGFIFTFKQAIKETDILEKLKFILASSQNNLVSLIQIQESSLQLDFSDIKQALEEDPTIALTKEFDSLINPLLSFISNMLTSSNLKQDKINEKLKKTLHELGSLYPGDEFLGNITNQLGLYQL